MDLSSIHQFSFFCSSISSTSFSSPLFFLLNLSGGSVTLSTFMFQLPLNPDGLFFVVSPPFPFFIPPLFCFLCFNVSFALSCFFSPFFLPRCVSFPYLPLSIFPFTCLSLYQSLTSACPSPLVFLQLSFFISYACLIFLFPLEPT